MDQEDIDKFEEKHLGKIIGVLMVILFISIMVFGEIRSRSYGSASCSKKAEQAHETVNKHKEGTSGFSDEQC